MIATIVSDEVWPELQFEIQRYGDDLYNEQNYVSGYLVANETPEDIRSLIQSATELDGVILIGDVAAAWFERDTPSYANYENFPTDLFYMDLDGIWEDNKTYYNYNGLYDTHTGNTDAEIWVGRIDAMTINGGDLTSYQNYFDKNHDYRTGGLAIPSRSMLYVDDDWINSSYSILNHVERAYDIINFSNDVFGTNAIDYLNKLTWGFEWVTMIVHSSPELHQFRVDGVYTNVYQGEIRDIHPKGLFYNLIACSAGRYVEENYIAGRYLFDTDNGLAVFASTKVGGMFDADILMQTVGSGENLGNAFKQWFNIKGKTDIDWYYGMHLLGDPTLEILQQTNLPIAEIEIEEYEEVNSSINLMGTALKGGAPDSVFNSYKIEIGPGISPDIGELTELMVTNNGLSEINGGVLGVLDTTDYADGIYTLLLTVDGGNLDNIYRSTININNLYLTSFEQDIYRAGEVLDIYGSSYYSDAYNIEWSYESSPENWLTTGINISGTGPIIDSRLATFDTSSINGSGVINIRVTYNNGGILTKDSINVIIDPELKEGWPFFTNYRFIVSAAVGNIDEDGTKEIVAATGTRSNGYIQYGYVWNYDGTSNFLNEKIAIDYQGANAIPLMVDIDNDGVNEVFLPSGDVIFAYDGSGNLLPGWGVSKAGDTIMQLAAGDIDNNGDIEILVTASKDKLYVYNHDGTAYGQGWPKDLPIGRLHPLAIGQLDDDPFLEIACGFPDNNVYLWNHDGSDFDGNWPQTIEYGGPTGMMMADIDNDDELEIIGVAQYGVYVWEANGDKIWSQDIQYSGRTSPPALGNVDEDESLEIVMAKEGTKISIYDSSNGGLSQFYDSGPLFSMRGTSYLTPPVLGDVDGDGVQEIIFVTAREYDDDKYDYLNAFNGDGSSVSGFPKIIPAVDNLNAGAGKFGDSNAIVSPIITDLDNDGKIDIVLAHGHYVYVWGLDSAYNFGNMDWPMSQRDTLRSGVYTKLTCNDPESYTCGDVNLDGAVNIADFVAMVNFLFKGGPAPLLECSGNVNGQDNAINVADLVYMVNYFFKGGPALTCQDDGLKSTETITEAEVDAYIQEYYQELSDQKRQEILEEIK